MAIDIAPPSQIATIIAILHSILLTIGIIHPSFGSELRKDGNQFVCTLSLKHNHKENKGNDVVEKSEGIE